MKELEQRLDVLSTKPMFLYCPTCDKVIYEADEINPTTLAVAETVGQDHADYFQYGNHNLIFYCKDPRGNLI